MGQLSEAAEEAFTAHTAMHMTSAATIRLAANRAPPDNENARTKPATKLALFVEASPSEDLPRITRRKSAGESARARTKLNMINTTRVSAALSWDDRLHFRKTTPNTTGTILRTHAVAKATEVHQTPPNTTAVERDHRNHHHEEDNEVDLTQSDSLQRRNERPEQQDRNRKNVR